MKTLLLPVFVLLSVTGASAQTIDNAKAHLQSKKLPDAKKEIDAVLALEKFQKNADAWYIKGKIYNDIALDPVLSKQYPSARMDAFSAIKKYTELDDRMLIALQIDGYKPINDIYTGFYQEAATRFNNKEYEKALSGFANAITVSTFMTDKRWINLKLDTNAVLYAGVAAEKLNRLPEAVLYYGKLIDAWVTGEGFVEIYKWVANYYYENKDQAAATRYLLIGKQVYPSDPFWTSLELDIARGKGNKSELFTLYEKAIANDAGNYLYRYNYAVELYQDAYNSDRTKRPANSEAMIAKAETQLKEVIRLAPRYARAQLFSGQVIYNKGVDQLTLAKTTTDEEKKKQLKTKALQFFNDAKPYFLAVEQLLAPATTTTKMKGDDKNDLKEAYDLLIIIYDHTGNKEKVSEYEIKFNALGKN